MPQNFDANICDASHISEKCNSKGCREFKMLYEGRLQRYCLLLSKEKEVIQKLGFVKNTGRLRSRTFDEVDSKDAKTRQLQRETKAIVDDHVRRNSIQCQPILRNPKNHCFLTPPSSVKSQRRFSEVGRLSPNCEAKFQEYKRHSLPSKIETPKKEAKSKRRQEEMQKKAQLRVDAIKSLETDCIKAKQLMSRFKSLSTTNLEIVGKQTDNFQTNEENTGKRRIHSWHI